MRKALFIGLIVVVFLFGSGGNGITYGQVTEILGFEGEVLSERRESGTDMHTIVYYPKHPRPVRAEIIDVIPPEQHNWYLPQWMDKDGVIWGIHQNKGLFKSKDKCASWQKVMDPPKIIVGSEEVNASSRAMMVSDTGRAVWCSGVQEVGGQAVKGLVFVSDEDKTFWTEAFQFDWGYGSIHYGHDKYQNVLLVSSYGDRTAPNQQPTQVIASFDHGETWREIGNFGQLKDRHVHDIAYDPWADRIWVSIGDNDNSNIGYTDDRGGSWHWLWKQGQEDAKQPTAIVPTPRGIIFGSDGPPNGLHFLPRKANALKPHYTGDDFISDFFVFNEHDMDRLTHVFHRGWSWTDQETDEELYLMGAADQHNRGYGRILASIDGLHWYEIWAGLDINSKSVYTLVGPHPEDADKTVLAWINIEGISHILKLRLPKFI